MDRLCLSVSGTEGYTFSKILQQRLVGPRTGQWKMYVHILLLHFMLLLHQLFRKNASLSGSAGVYKPLTSWLRKFFQTWPETFKCYLPWISRDMFWLQNIKNTFLACSGGKIPISFKASACRPIHNSWETHGFPWQYCVHTFQFLLQSTTAADLMHFCMHLKSNQLISVTAKNILNKSCIKNKTPSSLLNIIFP
jgi:hypothetical protein